MHYFEPESKTFSGEEAQPLSQTPSSLEKGIPPFQTPPSGPAAPRLSAPGTPLTRAPHSKILDPPPAAAVAETNDSIFRLVHMTV